MSCLGFRKEVVNTLYKLQDIYMLKKASLQLCKYRMLTLGFYSLDSSCSVTIHRASQSGHHFLCLPHFIFPSTSRLSHRVVTRQQWLSVHRTMITTRKEAIHPIEPMSAKSQSKPAEPIPRDPANSFLSDTYPALI